MEILTLPLAGEPASISAPDAAPDVTSVEGEMDVLAFEVWSRTNLPQPVEEDWPCDEETARGHSSCL